MEVKWIVPGPDNKLVIGGNRWDYQRPGIFLLDPRSGAYSQSPMTRAANQKFSVPFFMYGAFDHNGNLLIGNSDEGIHVFSAKDGAEITPWNPETQLKLISHTNLINDMIVDRRGSLWLATHDGLYRADAATGTFTNSGQNHAVNAILEDRQGNIWAACWGAVIRLEGNGKLTPVLAASDGFFDREINGLAEDAHGNLWIGNYEGLYRYDPRSEKLMRFTTHDGLISNNTIGKVFVSENRKQIIVGQEGGLNIVDIEALNRDTPSSPIAITALKIDNTEHPVDYSKPLVLKRDQKVLSVDFAALNYRNDNRYAVRLEGFDKEWIDIGSNHQAYYTNLDPGSYTLRVKVANAFGGWNASMLEWDIHVRPAYYETWWFRIAIVAVIVMILYGLYRYRVRQLLHVQAVRNRISADLHDEFGSTLSGISIMGTLARQGLSLRESSDQLVERMLEDVAQMSGSLDDIVWNISPKNDSLSNLMARLTRYASELFEARNIRYSFNFPDRADHIKLAMEDRRNLYLILKESVNNLVKYSGCTEAHIAMKILPRTLQVTICDNGSGFDADAKNDRNGIKNMRERARQLKGSITIRSAPGKGTHITIDIPR